MKAFEVNVHSWHHKLIRYMNKTHSHKFKWPRDFCSYWRLVVWSAVQAFLYYGLIVGVVGMLLGLTYLFPWDALKVVLGLAGVVAFIVALAVTSVIIRKAVSWYAGREPVEKPDGLFMTKYKAWKGKICPSIEYRY